MSNGSFKVLKASAGSGKTYALVSEYLTMALGSKRADYYRHILAITFTNAAAAEMKERVLTLLRKISEKSSDTVGLRESMADMLQIDPIELSGRAAQTYRHMLHHYGLLSVSTIDSFTHRLVRSFSRDLQIAHDFSVQLETDEFREAITDACLNQIGENKTLTAYFRRFTLDQMQEEKNWNPRLSILEITSELLKEESRNALEKLSEFSLEDFVAARKLIQEKQHAYKNQLREIAVRAIDLIESHGLASGDFANGGRGNISVLYKLREGEVDKPSNTFYNTLRKGVWHKKGISTEKMNAIQSIQDELTTMCNSISDLTEDSLLCTYHLGQAILEKLNSVGLLHELKTLSERYKQDENILLVQDFHELIGKIVSENEAPFIYERIGYRYRHILMDEFQDTSAMQWSNMVPLITNALGENNLNLVVGDAKQSIYRWRGGRAEQFVNLPEIEIGGVHQESEGLLKQHFFSENLPNNYRSAKSIVAFNNEFYKHICELFPYAQKIYTQHTQIAIRGEEGLVELVKISGADKTTRWPQTSAAILEYIRKTLEAGYQPGDIAILTRTGKGEGRLIAGLLTAHGYQVATLESLLIRNSPIVQAITGFMSYLLEKEDHYAMLQVVRGISAVHKSPDFTSFLEKEVVHENKKPIIHFETWLVHHFGSVPAVTLSDNPLSIALSLLAFFRFETDEFVEFFLEQIRRRNNSGNQSLLNWVEWWQKNQSRLYISTTPDRNSIRIMTIHKSKGLQFPVVIYPRFASTTRTNDQWIALDEETFHLPMALIRPNLKFADSVPELVQEKNKIILDDINLCYVATTRAEDVLCIIAEEGQGSSDFSKYFFHALAGGFENFRSSDDHWVMGQLPVRSVAEKEEKSTPIKHRFHFTTSPPIRKADSSADDQALEVYGRLLHAVLAEVQEAAQGLAQLEQIISSKTRDTAHKEKLVRDVQAVLRASEPYGWFKSGHSIFCERDIMARDGRLFRPDRVVLHAHSIELIDYKTGVVREEHRQQLAEYSALLQEIYNLEVESYLVYVQEDVQIIRL